MDPNATYEILRNYIDTLIMWSQINESEGLSEKEAYEIVDVADTVAEAFDALDGWIKKGGYLPNAWCNRD